MTVLGAHFFMEMKTHSIITYTSFQNEAEILMQLFRMCAFPYRGAKHLMFNNQGNNFKTISIVHVYLLSLDLPPIVTDCMQRCHRRICLYTHAHYVPRRV